MSMTLVTSNYVSSLEAPNHAAESCNFFDAATLASSEEDDSVDSFEDDDSASTYDDDDKSYEAESYCSDDDAFEENLSTSSDQDLRSSSFRPTQARSWSLVKSALEGMYREKVNEVVEQTFLSAEHAGMLLRSFRWSVEAAVEAWYSKEGEMNMWLGLNNGSVPRTSQPTGPGTCGICMEDCEEFFSASCDEHQFCRSCWTGYIDSAVASGKECLQLCCPHRYTGGEGRESGCPAAVSDSMILAFTGSSRRDLFTKRRLQSLVDADKCLRWCPAPGCSLAVQIEAGNVSSDSSVGVVCLNGHAFCWGCGETPHGPVSCEMARKWRYLNRCQGEEISLTLESIRQCPKCNVPIEKVGGCSHVECQCQHKFCWDCLHDLENHSDEDCGGPADGPDLSQLRNKQDLVSTESSRYGCFFLSWLECQEHEKQMRVILQDFHTRSSEWNGAISLDTLTFIADSWRAMGWREAEAYFTVEAQDNSFYYLDKLVSAKGALLQLHEAVWNATQSNGRLCTDTLGKLECASKSQLAAL